MKIFIQIILSGCMLLLLLLLFSFCSKKKMLKLTVLKTIQPIQRIVPLSILKKYLSPIFLVPIMYRKVQTEFPVLQTTDPEKWITGKASVRPIKIGAKVWIGGGVIILPGVAIGEGATIGAGSVVTRSIPARCVAVGNPCRIIKEL